MRHVDALDFSSNETWLSLTQGTVAAVVGLAGALVVFRLTVAQEHSKEAKRATIAESEREAERTAAAIADLVTATSKVVRDLRFAPFFGVAATADLLAAILRFVLVSRKRHPIVSEWVLAQHQLLSVSLARYRKLWLLPIGRKGRQGAWSSALGQLGGNLVTWQTGERAEDWFRVDLERLRGQVDPAP